MGLFDRLASSIVGDALPDEALERLALALALAERGDLEAAEARLVELLAAHPRVAALPLALGDLRVRRGDDEGAVDAYGRAVDQQTDATDAWLGLGEALVRLGRVDPAQDALRRVLSQAGDDRRRARAHAGRGRLAMAGGRVAKAVRELRKAAELLPGDQAVAADLGRALVAAGDPEGWPWLNRAAQLAIERSPGVVLDVALVVDAAAAAPRSDGAEALLEAALAAVGEAPPPNRRRARVEAALAASRARDGRIDEARALGARALGASADDPVVLAAWQQVAEAAGDYGEALRAARRASELGVALDLETALRLALGAEDRDAIARLAAAAPPDHALAGPLAAFCAGAAGDEALVTLGALAPGEGGRRFVARALAPPPPPEGNVFALLGWARDLASRTAELAPLVPAAARAAEAFDRPLLVAVMGEFNAGKSSFVNAFCGEEVAPVGATPTTATINVLRFGPAGGRVLYHDGHAQDLGATEVAGFLSDLGAEAALVRQVEIFFPLDVLRRVEIVDTPGLNSLRAEHEQVARAFLTEADAIIWLFAVGQAAKATEREAIGQAAGAGKRVLGVLSKADQADPSDLAAVERHVLQAMGDRIEALLPLSARIALRAVRDGDEAALQASGLPALREALEERFFRDARALKRRTALAALQRFGSEALALAGPGPHGDDAAARRAALDAREATVRGALAAERVALPARLDAAYRHAAAEVLEFVRPGRWPFVERRAESADEEFLFDLIEDAVARATEAARVTLEQASAGGPALPIAAALERLRAYARGLLAGGVVERFLHEQLPAAAGRVELPALQRALARRVPDVDSELFAPLEADVRVAFARARAAIDGDEARRSLRHMLRAERLHGPLNAFRAALADLHGKA